MENRTYADQLRARRFPFNDSFARRPQDDETADEVNRMENEGGPPPVQNKDPRRSGRLAPLRPSSDSDRRPGTERART